MYTRDDPSCKQDEVTSDEIPAKEFVANSTDELERAGTPELNCRRAAAPLVLLELFAASFFSSATKKLCLQASGSLASIYQVAHP